MNDLWKVDAGVYSMSMQGLYQSDLLLPLHNSITWTIHSLLHDRIVTTSWDEIIL